MTSKDLAIDWLGKTQMFGTLEPQDRQAVAAEMRDANYDAGQAIFARGDDGRDIFLVTEGRVRLSILTGEGRELSFAHAEPGQIFGEIAMLDGGKRTADATAVTKTKTLTLSKGALKRLMETRPQVAEAAIKFLCGRVREADQQLEAIALYPIEGRLARFFLATVTIDFEMSQSELALLVGASRPKVNTALSLLESSGAIERSGSKVVCDMDELRLVAGLD
jgi:CRP/FNR family transcriptional regulator, cyclic AMP receptor protein